jgi:hypothetical protein
MHGMDTHKVKPTLRNVVVLSVLVNRFLTPQLVFTSFNLTMIIINRKAILTTWGIKSVLIL